MLSNSIGKSPTGQWNHTPKQSISWNADQSGSPQSTIRVSLLTPKFPPIISRCQNFLREKSEAPYDWCSPHLLLSNFRFSFSGQSAHQQTFSRTVAIESVDDLPALTLVFQFFHSSKTQPIQSTPAPSLYLFASPCIAILFLG